VNIVWGALLIAVAVAVSVTAMLFVRRRAPDGSYFNDGDRAAGVFGVLATGLAVMLGFVVVLAFQSYDQSRSGAETEARVVTQLFETANLLPPATARRLGGEVICYGRSVIYGEWPRMAAGTEAGGVNPWGARMFLTVRSANPTTPVEQAAFSKWLDQTSERQDARQDRIHGAEGVIPSHLWIVLIFTAVVIFGFMFFFADSGEPKLVQATLIGTVVAVIVATMLVIRFLDGPFQPGVGALQPVAMERALTILDEERRVVGATGPVPCSETGTPVTQ
jgi:hypothetical protein